MMISERKAVWWLGVMTFLAIAVLFGTEEYARRREYPGLWAISFVDPAGDSLEFELANRSPERDFTVTVLAGEEVFGSRETLLSNEQRSVFFSPEAIVGTSELYGVVTIRVTDADGNTREISKRIE